MRELRDKVARDAHSAGISESSFNEAHDGANAYADAISLYLALAMTRMADWGNSLCRWESKAQVPQQLFGRQAIPMVWDFCEANPLSESTGSYAASLANIGVSFNKSSAGHVPRGVAKQADAQTQDITSLKWVSTDPPYYDNIGYADQPFQGARRVGPSAPYRTV